MPKEIGDKNSLAFKSKTMINLCEGNVIILKHSTPYYHQGNGLEESTNKSIVNNIKNILSRFGYPRKLVANNTSAFKSTTMINLCEENVIILTHSTPYYPQGNGSGESTNKSIVNGIKKMLFQNKKAWDTMLKYALWTYRVTTKKAIGTYHFQVACGTDATFLV